MREVEEEEVIDFVGVGVGMDVLLERGRKGDEEWEKLRERKLLGFLRVGLMLVVDIVGSGCLGCLIVVDGGGCLGCLKVVELIFVLAVVLLDLLLLVLVEMLVVLVLLVLVIVIFL